MKKLWDRLFPKYCRLPLLLVVCANFITYYATKLILPADISWWNLGCAVDEWLPVVPFFIVFYILAYFQWIGSYIGHCRAGVRVCYRIAAAALVAKLLCLVCFLVLPARIERPEMAGGGLFEWATRVIYSLDEPNNLFPSIHCLESWLCFRGAMLLPKKKPCYIAAQGALTLLVCASTVLIRQHYFADILGGILAAEIGLFISGRCGGWRLFETVQTPSVKAWLIAHSEE